MFSLRTLSGMLLGLNLLGSIHAQNNVTVEESDPALVYSPFLSGWHANNNPLRLADRLDDANDWHEGSGVSINLPGATVTLTFNGSYIAYYSDLNKNHGLISVTLDNKTTTLSTYNAAGAVPQVKLFESFVNPDLPNHIITLTCLEHKNLGLDYFLYTSATPEVRVPSSQTSSITSQAPPGKTSAITSSTLPPVAPPEQGAAFPSSSTGPVVVVAAAFAAIGWAIAFLFAFLFLRLRRQRATSTVSPPGPQSRLYSAPIYPLTTEPLTVPPDLSAQPNGPAATCGFVPSTGEFGGPPVSVAASSPRTLLQSPPAYSSEDR